MRKWLKQKLPSHSDNHQYSDWSINWLKKHTYLWRLNRKTVAKGVASGLLVAFIPLPAQILLASLLALILRGNLPIAVVMTLISNPLTFIPINLLILHIGSFFIVDTANPLPIPDVLPSDLTWSSLTHLFYTIFEWAKSQGSAYVTGLVILSSCASLLGFFTVHILWRISIILHLHRKRKKK